MARGRRPSLSDQGAATNGGVRFRLQHPGACLALDAVAEGMVQPGDIARPRAYRGGGRCRRGRRCVRARSAVEADWSQAQPMTVITKEYRFTPKHLKLQRNVPYRVHFENPGKEMHEFNA